MSDAQTIRRLREELEEAREALRQAEEMGSPDLLDQLRNLFGLTGQEGKFLAALMRVGPGMSVSQGVLISRIDATQDRSADAVITSVIKLRVKKKIAASGAAVSARCGSGYYLDPRSRAALWSAVREGGLIAMAIEPA